MDAPKNIVFLEAIQDYGGARISTVEIAERLKELNSVKMLDFYGCCIPFLVDVQKRDIQLQIIQKRETPFIINLSSNPFRKIINYFLYIPHWLSMRKKTQEAIRKVAPDFVIINNFKVLSALIFFRGKKFKTLFFARGWFVPMQLSGIEKYMLKRWVDNYLCVSQATRHALYCNNFTTLENLYVVPNAINEAKISKEKAIIKKEKSTKVILHAGGFLKDKGQVTSLQAAKILKERGVDFKLILAGIIYKGKESALYHDYIKNLVIQYQLTDNVELVVNKPNVISYFNACDILIHPSETEGLPRVIMEAMILKKPVVANAVGGVTDYLLNGYTGFLPQHNSSGDYADCIERLFNDENLYNYIAKNAYELVSKVYTENNQLNSLFKVFEKK